MLLQLPPELLIRIVGYIPDISDKCQLLLTCKYMHDFLCSHVICWSNLDLSPFDKKMNNTILLAFLKRVNIPLYTNYNSLSNQEEGGKDLMKTMITRLDLSGCWNLSDDLIVTLSKSLGHLKELCLNGYRLHPPMLSARKRNDTPSIAFEQQRDHVYQVRPSHDLSSMAMDLSKKSSHRLKVPLVLLSTILDRLQCLTHLSIQYQDLSIAQQSSHVKRLFSGFKHVQHIDISSCIINQPTLQVLLRSIGPNLLTLKMLNIDLNNLTLLSLCQYGKKLTCLHLSCNEPSLLPSLGHVVGCLHQLQDFRLTRIRTGSVDVVIQRLLPSTLKRLDLSPKMNIYPKSPPSTSTSTVTASTSASTAGRHRSRVQLSSSAHHRKHPPQSPKLLSIANYATTEHDLLFSDNSLYHVAQCKYLVELRLCFPTISANALTHLFESIPQLEVFELRQKNSNLAVDYLRGLRYCQHLKELVLLSVYLSQETMDDLLCNDYALKHTLRHMTLSDSGAVVEQGDHVQLILSNFTVLHTLCLGQLMNPIQWDAEIQDKHNVVIYKKHGSWSIQ